MIPEHEILKVLRGCGAARAYSIAERIPHGRKDGQEWARRRLKRLERDGLVRMEKRAGAHWYFLTPRGAWVASDIVERANA